MKTGRLFYFLGKSVSSLRGNRVVHLVGLSTMAVSLLILGTFLLLLVNFGKWMEDTGRATSMSVYLKEGISEGARERVAEFLKKMPFAEIKRYISKEAALDEFRKALGSQASLLDGLSRNPLPASFDVTFQSEARSRVDLQQAKRQIEALEGVEEAQYSEAWLERFERLLDIIRLAGFVLVGILCIGVLFIITNTIKLTILSRKEEIEVLKLVGATEWFVKAPFLLEGAIHGLVSAALAMGILYGAYLIVSSKKLQFLGLASLKFEFLPWEYSTALFALSLGLGCVGSLVAVSRFFEA